LKTPFVEQTSTLHNAFFPFALIVNLQWTFFVGGN